MINVENVIISTIAKSSSKGAMIFSLFELRFWVLPNLIYITYYKDRYLQINSAVGAIQHKFSGGHGAR